MRVCFERLVQSSRLPYLKPAWRACRHPLALRPQEPPTKFKPSVVAQPKRWRAIQGNPSSQAASVHKRWLPAFCYSHRPKCIPQPDTLLRAFLA